MLNPCGVRKWDFWNFVSIQTGCHKPKNEEKGKFIFKLAEKISTKIREKDYNMYINY